MSLTRDEFGAYLKSLANLMRLGHWTLDISDKPPKNADAWASVTCWDGRFGATIYLSDGILTESPEDQRYVAIHELLHCHFAHPDKIAADDMSPVRREAWTLAMEYGVDAIAQAIAPFMPLFSEAVNGPLEPH